MTLIEVVVAVALLALVLLALVGLEGLSLRVGRESREVQRLTREAENFLESLRRNPGQVPTACGEGSTLSLGGSTGRCTYRSCTLAPDGGISCGGSGSANAYEVTLEVPSPNPRVVLRTVVVP
ncbi:MAG: prepilin [Thermus sp.]|uniref:prepilin n=1 Tax=Thermus sp. TaxID=275 RepID=UPI00298EF082|nr:prepilin [Thermus sp.]MDW8018263.1 prepilin [Thermus sp.]